MKRRLYFFISTIAQIIISICCIVFSKYYYNQTIQYLDSMYLQTKDSNDLAVLNLYKNFGMHIIIGIAIIILLFNLTIFYKLRKDKQNIPKRFIVASGIVGFLMSDSYLIYLLSLINLVFCSIKNTKDDKKVKEIIELPKINISMGNIKYIIKAIILIVVYFGLPFLIKILPLSYITLSIINDVVMIIICLILFYNEFINGFKVLFSKFKTYFKFVIGKHFSMLLIYFLAAIVIALIIGDQTTTVNQEIAQSLPLLYIIPASVIYAPVVEELVFRGSLRRLIKNNYIFILISGLIFGLLHTMYEKTIFDMLLLSLPYSILGGYFAYLYVKTDNIAVPITTHFIHNSFACIMILLV